MDLRDYLNALRKGWWLVLLCIAIALAAAALVTVRTPKQYASTVKFFVTTSSTGTNTDAYQGGLFSQQRVKSYADLMTSERLAKAIISSQGVQLSPGDVARRITATVEPDTVLLQATVTDVSSQRAQQIAQGVTSEFAKLVKKLETPPDASRATVKVEVVEGPNLLAGPVSPKPMRNLALAGILGLLLGFALALLRERLDTSVKSVEQLDELAGAPSLAAIAFDATAKKSPLLLRGSSHSARAEALRQLRTNLQFVDVDSPRRVVVVTSAVPNEGKSSTATNLAITMAEAESRVLLLEGDLRRPRAAEYLGLEGAVGLTNVLVGQADIEEALQPWGDGRLSVLPSGSIPPNPSELLASAGMERLLAQMRERFDVIVIDSPPLLPVTDGAVLAVRADGALLVVRHGVTTTGQVSAAVAALKAVDARLIGTVMTMVPPRGAQAAGYAGTYGYASITESERASSGRPPSGPSGGQPSSGPSPRPPLSTGQVATSSASTSAGGSTSASTATSASRSTSTSMPAPAGRPGLLGRVVKSLR